MNCLVQALGPRAPLFATVSLVASVLWIGALFTTSWLCGRARLMADGAEIGSLALLFHRRWASRCFLLGGTCGLLALAGAPGVLRPSSAAGAALALLALVWLHARVGRRADRISRGRGIHGEAGHQLALMLSLAVLTALVGLRLTVPH